MQLKVGNKFLLNFFDFLKAVYKYEQKKSFSDDFKRFFQNSIENKKSCVFFTFSQRIEKNHNKKRDGGKKKKRSCFFESIKTIAKKEYPKRNYQKIRKDNYIIKSTCLFVCDDMKEISNVLSK